MLSYKDPINSEHGFIKWRKIRQDSKRICQEYNIKTLSIDEFAGSLSGGNQQKVVVGRELNRNPKLLIAREKMLTKRLEQLIYKIPKGENHIHIEGSIPAKTALLLAKRNGMTLPFSTEEGMRRYIKENVVNLDSFMKCDRLINSVCIYEEDYYEVVLALGEQAAQQNIIYSELLLDYPPQSSKRYSVRCCSERL